MIQTNALPCLPIDWVGRKDLIAELDEDYKSLRRCVTGIIGFGGEGKTTLIRKWLDDAFLKKDSASSESNILNSPQRSVVKGIFWYSFLPGNNSDTFFEEAISFFLKDARKYVSLSPSIKSKILLSFLKEQGYLIVLDSVQSCQHQEGECYGLLKSKELSGFLRAFAECGHNSFCVISSRVPIVDLIDFSSYIQRSLKGLSYGDCRLLLRKIGLSEGIKNHRKVEELIRFWNGYALGIKLTGAYFLEEYNGTVEGLPIQLERLAGKSNYERLFAVLGQYKESFSNEQADILHVLSVIREPDNARILEKLVEFSFEDIEKLIDLRIIEVSESSNYLVHPLVRLHYTNLLHQDSEQAVRVHLRISDCYRYFLEEEIPSYPSLKQLQPAIELVHHLCKAERYDEANSVRVETLNQNNSYVLTHQLCAYEQAIEIASDFFPNSDTLQDPLFISPEARMEMVNEVGYYLMCVGRLDEATSYLERHKESALNSAHLEQLCISYINLSELYAHLGKLGLALDSAKEAVSVSLRMPDDDDEVLRLRRTALARRGWATHLTSGEGEEWFERAKVYEKKLDPKIKALYSLRGIQHADHLRKRNKLKEAQIITEANLAICVDNQWIDHISQCQRVLGNIFESYEDNDKAATHFQNSLTNARLCGRKDVLIRILLARGRWHAKLLNYKEAIVDLDESFYLSESCCYFIYEISTRIALSLAYSAGNDYKTAKYELREALDMSRRVDYFWGKRESATLLKNFVEVAQ